MSDDAKRRFRGISQNGCDSLVIQVSDLTHACCISLATGPNLFELVCPSVICGHGDCPKSIHDCHPIENAHRELDPHGGQIVPGLGRFVGPLNRGPPSRDSKGIGFSDAGDPGGRGAHLHGRLGPDDLGDFPFRGSGVFLGSGVLLLRRFRRCSVYPR